MQVGERRQHIDSDMEERVDARRRQLVTRFARVTGESHEIRTGGQFGVDRIRRAKHDN